MSGKKPQVLKQCVAFLPASPKEEDVFAKEWNHVVMCIRRSRKNYLDLEENDPEKLVAHPEPPETEAPIKFFNVPRECVFAEYPGEPRNYAPGTVIWSKYPNYYQRTDNDEWVTYWTDVMYKGQVSQPSYAGHNAAQQTVAFRFYGDDGVTLDESEEMGWALTTVPDNPSFDEEYARELYIQSWQKAEDKRLAEEEAAAAAEEEKRQAKISAENKTDLKLSFNATAIQTLAAITKAAAASASGLQAGSEGSVGSSAGLAAEAAAATAAAGAGAGAGAGADTAAGDEEAEKKKKKKEESAEERALRKQKKKEKALAKLSGMSKEEQEAYKQKKKEKKARKKAEKEAKKEAKKEAVAAVANTIVKAVAGGPTLKLKIGSGAAPGSSSSSNTAAAAATTATAGGIDFGAAAQLSGMDLSTLSVGELMAVKNSKGAVLTGDMLNQQSRKNMPMQAATGKGRKGSSSSSSGGASATGTRKSRRGKKRKRGGSSMDEEEEEEDEEYMDDEDDDDFYDELPNPPKRARVTIKGKKKKEPKPPKAPKARKASTTSTKGRKKTTKGKAAAKGKKAVGGTNGARRRPGRPRGSSAVALRKTTAKEKDEEAMLNQFKDDLEAEDVQVTFEQSRQVVGRQKFVPDSFVVEAVEKVPHAQEMARAQAIARQEMQRLVAEVEQEEEKQWQEVAAVDGGGGGSGGTGMDVEAASVPDAVLMEDVKVLPPCSATDKRSSGAEAAGTAGVQVAYDDAKYTEVLEYVGTVRLGDLRHGRRVRLRQVRVQSDMVGMHKDGTEDGISSRTASGVQRAAVLQQRLRLRRKRMRQHKRPRPSVCSVFRGDKDQGEEEEEKKVMKEKRPLRIDIAEPPAEEDALFRAPVAHGKAEVHETTGNERVLVREMALVGAENPLANTLEVSVELDEWNEVLFPVRAGSLEYGQERRVYSAPAIAEYAGLCNPGTLWENVREDEEEMLVQVHHRDLLCTLLDLYEEFDAGDYEEVEDGAGEVWYRVPKQLVMRAIQEATREYSVLLFCCIPQLQCYARLPQLKGVSLHMLGAEGGDEDEEAMQVEAASVTNLLSLDALARENIEYLKLEAGETGANAQDVLQESGLLLPQRVNTRVSAAEAAQLASQTQKALQADVCTLEGFQEDDRKVQVRVRMLVTFSFARHAIVPEPDVVVEAANDREATHTQERETEVPSASEMVVEG